jgi:tRNA A37 threonylcarbamoyladenosine modification protein TsaB
MTIPEGSWVSGPGVRRYAEKFPASLRRVESERWDPQPSSLLQLGLERYRRGERDDVWTLEPLYLRPSAAEEKQLSKDKETGR